MEEGDETRPPLRFAHCSQVSANHRPGFGNDILQRNDENMRIKPQLPHFLFICLYLKHSSLTCLLCNLQKTCVFVCAHTYTETFIFAGIHTKYKNTQIYAERIH